jgi:DNA-3-methyladenine glycosylase I
MLQSGGAGSSFPGQTAGHDMARAASAVERCPWCGNDPLYMAYHDEEWGVPVRDDRTWFEFLVLEGAQAGLSWLTILKKRANYRRAFDDFDVRKVARYTPAKVEKLMQDAGIVRNRLKIESTISNAKAFIAVQKEFGSFDAYMWQWVNGVPLVNRPRTMKDVPASTALSDRISKDLKKRGFRFVGSTIIYAHLQATGVVNDHLVGCHRHPDNQKASTRRKRP